MRRVFGLLTAAALLAAGCGSVTDPEPTSYTLTVHVSAAPGNTNAVTSDPAWIECRQASSSSTPVGVCSGTAAPGVVVRLIAPASDSAGHPFVEWRGDACDESPALDCDVTMNGDRTVQAFYGVF